MSEILGVLFAVLIGILVIPKFGQYQKASNDASIATITAQQQKQLLAAGTAYIQQNASAIQGTATATTPVIVTVPMLQAPAVNLLPSSFSAINPFGQTWQVEVLQPTAGNLQALAMAIGGTAVTDVQAGKIAAIVGAAGGLIPLNDSGIYASGAANAYGAASGWNISTANYQGVAGGHPAALITFQNGQLNSNYLYRNAVPGQPQLNTMNTPLVMASVQTVGSACATNGAIAQDGSGGIVSCQAGVWKTIGDGKCIYSLADMNSFQTDARCYNGNGNPNSPAGADWIFVEVYRHVNLSNYYVAQRVVGMTGPSVGGVWTRNQQSNTQGGGWTPWMQQADAAVNITHNAGEGGMISIAGADGTKMFMETMPGGTLRFVNSAFTAQIANLDQTGVFSAVGVNLPSGPTLKIGNSMLYGDSANIATRTTGGFYVQNANGTSAANISQVANIAASGYLSTAVDTYGVIARNAAGADNSQVQNPIGSGYFNDVFIRSVGKWVSQIAASIGEGQRWYDVTGARCAYCGYQNTTGRAIMVNVSVDSPTGGQIISHLYVDGVDVGEFNQYNQRYNNVGFFSAIVPNGSSYYVALDGGSTIIGRWSELR